MRLYSKEDLVEQIREVSKAGWHKSVKMTIDTRNDGAVGNTLEKLLGIQENNLPIPNAREWELKGQRKHSASLITLKHIEPSPTAARIVSNILLPLYGWRHPKCGVKYPQSEKSFRSTTSATAFTSRGFHIVVDRFAKKLRFVFDSSKTNVADPTIASWLQCVERNAGLGPIKPEPYWGFDDLKYAIGTKIMNSFYVVADTKIDDRHEYFKYETLYILSGFSFEKFINCIEAGHILIDFDARTGHNHGTKFRMRQGHWPSLYSSVEKAI